MAKWLQGGQTVVKVVNSWCMMYQVERLVDLIRVRHAWSFTHVKRDGNKVANLMANIGERRGEQLVEIQLSKEGGNEWQLQCSHLVAQDLKLAQELMGRTGQALGHLLEVQVSPSSISRNHHPPSSWFIVSTSSSRWDMNSQGFPSSAINAKRFLTRLASVG